MLEEDERPSGPEHPGDLAEGPVLLTDRAEHQTCDDHVEAVVGEVERGGVSVQHLYSRS